ncbi:MAG: TIGR00730 family Rossman fold protein [Bacteroidales bacterium]|nr:TIGR00730 family Rossman fold protein [Bacteroidales bacterium]
MLTREEQERIRKSFKAKNWSETKAEDAWSIFKIMGEFANGYEKMSAIGPCVAIFGSARTKPDDKYYVMAEEIAYELTQRGFGVITGGGPGIMEAGNKGAHRGGGKSVGLNIILPMEQTSNPYIDKDKSIDFQYFFTRKTIFTRYAQGFIVMPGGFGTLDEFFEALTLVQTEKLANFPIVLVGKSYWQGMLDWIETTMVDEGNINADELQLFKVVETVEAAVNIIEDFYTRYALRPNF